MNKKLIRFRQIRQILYSIKNFFLLYKFLYINLIYLQYLSNLTKKKNFILL